jgi:flagellar biosynthesis/type III secretory pathway chaperone
MTQQAVRENLTLFQQEISLYQELLDCLEAETQALVNAQEEFILAAAARKELLLDRLLKMREAQAGEPEALGAHDDMERLTSLHRQVAAINARNRDIAAASLEVIQEFLAQFQPTDPGVYRPGGQAISMPEAALFQRQA